jgi:hypothetical protein
MCETLKIFVDNNIFDANILIEKDIAQDHKRQNSEQSQIAFFGTAYFSIVF